MALTLIKEDGSGMANANSYANAADGDAYHEGHLYATTWTGAVTATKEAALVMATRVIDAMFRFHGFKRIATQALQWPRYECRDPDAVSGAFLDETKVPAVVVQATCELARELMEADRTDNPMGEGLKTLRIEGALQLDFDAKDRLPPVPRLVQATLGRFGEYLRNSGGMAKLIRV